MKKWRYKVIEYGYSKLTDKEVEVCMTIHKTNSKLIYYLIILCLKIQNIKYSTIIEY